MKKQDWIDYFEAVNGRSPEPQEVEAALLAGEFSDEAPVTETPVNPEVSQGIEGYQEQLNQQFQNFQQNPHVVEAKKQGLNYFNWLVATLKNPVAKAEKGNFNYAIVTLVLSALFMGSALTHVFRRTLSALANISIGGTSFRIAEPEKYARVTAAISSEFGLTFIISTTLFVLVIYVVAVLIPVIVEFLAGKQSQVNLKDEIGKSSQFLPLIMILNFVGLVTTFTIPSSLIVSENALYSLSTAAGSFNITNPLPTVVSYLSMAQEIPVIKSFGSVVSYLILISFIGFVVLLVALINNIEDPIKKINHFYVSIIAVLFFVAITFFVDKMLAEKISEVFISFLMNADLFKLF